MYLAACLGTFLISMFVLISTHPQKNEMVGVQEAYITTYGQHILRIMSFGGVETTNVEVVFGDDTFFSVAAAKNDTGMPDGTMAEAFTQRFDLGYIAQTQGTLPEEGVIPLLVSGLSVSAKITADQRITVVSETTNQGKLGVFTYALVPSTVFMLLVFIFSAVTERSMMRREELSRSV